MRRSHGGAGGSYHGDDPFMYGPFAASPPPRGLYSPPLHQHPMHPHHPHHHPHHVGPLSSSAPSSFRFSRLPISASASAATPVSLLSTALSSAAPPSSSSTTTTTSSSLAIAGSPSSSTSRLLSSFVGQLRQLQDLLGPLQACSQYDRGHPSNDDDGDDGDGDATTTHDREVPPPPPPQSDPRGAPAVAEGEDEGAQGQGEEARSTPNYGYDYADGGAFEAEQEQRAADAMIRRLLVHPDHQSQQHGLREELEAATAVVAKLRARIARVTSFVRFMARHGVVNEAAAGTYGYFAALPNELILCILSHTDPKTLLLSVSGLNRTWRAMAEDSNVWGVLYGRQWSTSFPSHAAIPRSASFYDMEVDDYNPRERKLKRRRYGWMERFKERACVDRNWLKRGSYSVCVKHVESAESEYTRLACADSRLFLVHRKYRHHGFQQQQQQQPHRFVFSHHKWEEQGAFTDTVGTAIATPHRAEISDIQACGELVVTSSSDGTALAWDIASGSMLHRVAEHEDEIVQARLASFTTLITASDRTVAIWDVQRGQRIGGIEHQHAVRCIGVNDDDDSPIVSGSTDGVVRVWDRRKLDTPVAVLQVGGVPTALHLHEHGLLVAGNYAPHEGGHAHPSRSGAYLQRWQGNALVFADGLRKPIRHLTADHSRILVGQGGTVAYYDVASPGLLATYESGCADVDSLLLDPTRLLVVGDGELAVHDFSGRSLEAFGYRELRGVRVT